MDSLGSREIDMINRTYFFCFESSPFLKAGRIAQNKVTCATGFVSHRSFMPKVDSVVEALSSKVEDNDKDFMVGEFMLTQFSRV